MSDQDQIPYDDKRQSSFVISIPPPEDENDQAAIVHKIRLLQQERAHLDEQIKLLRGSVPRGTHIEVADHRPTWGPCTRCAHVWRGHWPNQPPRGCPRCGSSGWRVPPTRADARHPDDPPNPNWGKNRITGKPTDPENVLGRKTRAARIAREALRKRRRAEQALAHEAERRHRLEAQSLTAPTERLTGLTPPPRLEDVIPIARPTMVAPMSVRFADPIEPPDGVPVRIEKDGTITPIEPAAPPAPSAPTEEDLLEAINDSGAATIEGDDEGEEEVQPDGNDQ